MSGLWQAQWLGVSMIGLSYPRVALISNAMHFQIAAPGVILSAIPAGIFRMDVPAPGNTEHHPKGNPAGNIEGQAQR